ncbi:ASCH domain-containing protein (plasmid) [Nocardia sp. CA-084685]|uniref:ASCH domain-containing protein n=1 Tax=Nocardia sp. CA-084685 TaxID=3239970 RepID=UPI003D97CAA1
MALNAEELAEIEADEDLLDSLRAAAMVMTPAKALSVRRPWANLIVAGHKPIENRTWSTRYRGEVVIHAGARWERDGADLAAALNISGFASSAQCPSGYLGVAQLRDVHRAAGCCAPWGQQDQGVYHWVFTDAVALPAPVPGPGRLGLYRVPADVRAVLR